MPRSAARTSPLRGVADDSWLRDKLPITKGSLSRSHEPSVTTFALNARPSVDRETGDDVQPGCRIGNPHARQEEIVRGVEFQRRIGIRNPQMDRVVTWRERSDAKRFREAHRLSGHQLAEIDAWQRPTHVVVRLVIVNGEIDRECI